VGRASTLVTFMLRSFGFWRHWVGNEINEINLVTFHAWRFAVTELLCLWWLDVCCYAAISWETTSFFHRDDTVPHFPR
jgi:hypothetical protein